MIESIELACAFDHHHLLDILYDTHCRGIAMRIGTDTAQLAVADVVATLAVLYILSQGYEAFAQALSTIGLLTEQMEHEPQSGLLSHSWQLGKFFYCIFK